MGVVSPDRFFSVDLQGLGRETLRCDCHADIWIASTSGWRLYAWPENTVKVRFVRAPDPHAPDRETVSIHLVGPNGEAMRGHFAPLYDDRGQPLAAPFARWGELRTKYGGQDEVKVEHGMLAPSARPVA